MDRIKAVLSVLFALLVVVGGVYLPYASAAPTSTSVLFLAMEGVPATFSASEAAKKTELQNAAGTLKGKGFSLTAELLKPTGGLYKATFTEVEEPVGRTRCNTTGANPGEVVTPTANFFVVHTLTERTGRGVVLEVPEFTIHCGTLPTKVKGTAVESVLSLTGDVTSFKSSLLCKNTSGGEPVMGKYWTSLLTSELSAGLLVSFGNGFRKSCELVEGEVSVTSNKMVELME